MAFTKRSEQSRAAILAAARRRFAEDGFDRATIRAIAAEADIDPSMVMRYYGSKDGLFAAAVDVDLRLPDVTEVPLEQRGEAMVRHFLERWEGNDTMIFLLRSAVTNEIARARLHEVFADQVAARFGAETGALISSQLIGIALCRYVLRVPTTAAMSAETLIRRVGPTIQGYLGT